jgi:hypothetical protein
LYRGKGPRAPVHAARAACFAPNTPHELLEQYEQTAAYSALYRWSLTANGSTNQSGYPITLTYSFVPDGVSIPNGGVGGPDSSPNNLKATMDAIFGSTDAWKKQFQTAFARWSELTGVTYVEEPNDDGAAFPDSQGILGVRGDIRIAMRALDGTGNVLAFNYYPNWGDMVLDVDEDWGNSANSYLTLRNIVMHEAGHGLGLEHVWPLDETKLMEPILATMFDGPQDDDIRGAHSYYGDLYELNNTLATASDMDNLPGALGSETVATLSGQVKADNASILSTSDSDWYKFYVPASQDVQITVTPLGSSYQVGASSDNTPSVNNKTMGDLAFELVSTDQVTVLADVDSAEAGQTESFTASLVVGGTYYLRVYADSSSGPQRYELSVVTGALSDPCGIDTDGNGVGDYCDSQLAFAECPGDVYVSADGSGGATATWTLPSVTGPYGSWTMSADHEPGEFFSVGETVVTYTAVDASGKTAQCSFRVVVSDTLVAGVTVAGPMCGFLGTTTFTFMVVSYSLVLLGRRR